MRIALETCFGVMACFNGVGSCLGFVIHAHMYLVRRFGQLPQRYVCCCYRRCAHSVAWNLRECCSGLMTAASPFHHVERNLNARYAATIDAVSRLSRMSIESSAVQPRVLIAVDIFARRCLYAICAAIICTVLIWAISEHRERWINRVQHLHCSYGYVFIRVTYSRSLVGCRHRRCTQISRSGYREIRSRWMISTSLIQYALPWLPCKLNAVTIDTGHMLNVPTIENAEPGSCCLLSCLSSLDCPHTIQ
jgi:hypothetical protein